MQIFINLTWRCKKKIQQNLKKYMRERERERERGQECIDPFGKLIN